MLLHAYSNKTYKSLQSLSLPQNKLQCYTSTATHRVAISPSYPGNTWVPWSWLSQGYDLAGTQELGSTRQQSSSMLNWRANKNAQSWAWVHWAFQSSAGQQASPVLSWVAHAQTWWVRTGLPSPAPGWHWTGEDWTGQEEMTKSQIALLLSCLVVEEGIMATTTPQNNVKIIISHSSLSNCHICNVREEETDI